MQSLKLPRFGLRALFALITLCAIVAAWGHSCHVWIVARHKFVNHELPKDGTLWAACLDTAGWHSDIDNEASELPWSLRIWGKSLHAIRFYVRENLPPEELASTQAELSRLFPEAEITFLDF